MSARSTAWSSTPVGKRAVTAWVGWYTYPSSCGSGLTRDIARPLGNVNFSINTDSWRLNRCLRISGTRVAGAQITVALELALRPGALLLAGAILPQEVAQGNQCLS